jgi:hypothetical protein
MYKLRHILAFSIFLIAQVLFARQSRLNDPLFISDFLYRQTLVEGQGSFYTQDVDTTRMEAAFSLRYGIRPNLDFSFAFPYASETQGLLSKSGQGDLVTALTLYGSFSSVEWLKWGLRETVSFPTGFREELSGFPAFTHDRAKSETLALLEIIGLNEGRQSFLVDLHLGFDTDNHRQNTHLIWGIGFRKNLFKQIVFLESEFGQEMRTDNKFAEYQFFVGARTSLPFGLGLKLGVEQHILEHKDVFGIFASMYWSYRPRIPVEIRSRHLRSSLQSVLDNKNKVPGFTLEPGAPGVLEEEGRFPFLPLKIAVLPFEESSSFGIAEFLHDNCLNNFENDTLLSVIPHEDITQAMEISKLQPGKVLSAEDAQNLGLELNADFLVYGKIIEHNPRVREGFSLKPLFAHVHTENHLSAMTWLFQVKNAHIEYKGIIEAVASSDKQWRLIHADRGEYENLIDPLKRHQLERENVERWTKQALDNLFYEYSVQWVVE